jgi:hypothetical protein
MNFSRIDAAVDGYRLSPRKVWDSVTITSDKQAAYDEEFTQMKEAHYQMNADSVTLPKRTEMYRRNMVDLSSAKTGSLLLIDTQRERDINLAMGYKFDPLKEGECIISRTRASQLLVEPGHAIKLGFNSWKNLLLLANNYNARTTHEEFPTRIKISDMKKQHSQDPDSFTLHMPCKVAHTVSVSHGKYDKDNVESTLLMEYGVFMQHLTANLPNYLNANDDFKRWLLT